nr:MULTISPECIES: hypothetical protein [Sinorhizobium]
MPERAWPNHRDKWARKQQGGSVTGIVGVAAIALFAASEFIPPIVGCDIKGNISYQTGERIYHIPGQEYYSETRISLLNGEWWFCSEEAAREAGWRKAHR